MIGHFIAGVIGFASAFAAFYLTASLLSWDWSMSHEKLVIGIIVSIVVLMLSGGEL